VGTVAAGEVDDPIVVQRLCIGTHVDHAVVAGADRAGVVEAVAVRAAGPQVDPAVGQVDPPAGPIVDAVVAVPEAGDVVVDDPDAAVAVGEEVVRGERDDGARDVAGVVDLVGTVAANHGDRDGRVGFDGAAVVQRGGAEQRFHLHGDRRGVVAGGDGAGVLDQHVAVGPRVDADRGAVSAGCAADRTAVGHRRAVVAVGKGADAHAVGPLGGDVAAVGDARVAAERIGVGAEGIAEGARGNVAAVVHRRAVVAIDVHAEGSGIALRGHAAGVGGDRKSTR